MHSRRSLSALCLGTSSRYAVDVDVGRAMRARHAVIQNSLSSITELGVLVIHFMYHVLICANNVFVDLWRWHRTHARLLELRKVRWSISISPAVCRGAPRHDAAIAGGSTDYLAIAPVIGVGNGQSPGRMARGGLKSLEMVKGVAKRIDDVLKLWRNGHRPDQNEFWSNKWSK